LFCGRHWFSPFLLLSKFFSAQGGLFFFHFCSTFPTDFLDQDLEDRRLAKWVFQSVQFLSSPACDVTPLVDSAHALPKGFFFSSSGFLFLDTLFRHGNKLGTVAASFFDFVFQAGTPFSCFALDFVPRFVLRCRVLLFRYTSFLAFLPSFFACVSSPR